MKSEEYIQHLEEQGIKPKKYLIGDAVLDGHGHLVYIRDDSPVASSSAKAPNALIPHAHPISVGLDGKLMCGFSENHTHTKFTLLPED